MAARVAAKYPRTESTCATCSGSPVNRDVSTTTPGIRFCASASAKFMRDNSAAEFTQSAFSAEYPVGSILRYSGCAELRGLIGQRECEIDIGVQRAHRADDHLERRLHLRPQRALAPELLALEHRLHHRAEIAVVLRPSLRHAIDQRCRRIVGNESNAPVAREMNRAVDG